MNPLEKAYLEQALPEPVVLLHQNLKPYSLGHEMHLRRHESPFVTLERMPELEDLFMAVYICACEFDEAQRELGLPKEEFDGKFQAWYRLCEPLPEGDEALALILDFQKYIRDGSKCPKFHPIYTGGPRSKPGAPLLLGILRTLMSAYGFSREEALNMPYGWAFWCYLTQAEQERKVRIVTQGDEDKHALILAEMKKRGWEPLRVQRKPMTSEQAAEVGAKGGG